MSMFSIHYIIADATRCYSASSGDFYWTGAHPANPLFWGGYDKAVRFHTKASAEAVRDGVLSCLDKTQVQILADE